MNKNNLISSFVLRIIAIITMTIDHIAIVLSSFALVSINSAIYILMRIIGRLSLPLFAFGIFEGTLHTKNSLKYLLRLGISAITISLSLFIVSHFGAIDVADGNIFIDLFMGALIILLLKLPKYKKLFAIIPIGICCLLICSFIPPYLRLQYRLYGVSLIVGFYLSYLLANVLKGYYKDKLSFSDDSSFEESNIYRNLQNLLAILALVIVNCIFFVISHYDQYLSAALNMSIQMYSLISGAFLLFYNGHIGYNKKWFQYGCYLYYPLHIILIYGIIYLVS